MHDDISDTKQAKPGSNIITHSHLYLCNYKLMFDYNCNFFFFLKIFGMGIWTSESAQ